MKIAGVRTISYEVPQVRAIADANLPHGRRNSAGTAIFIDTDEGVTGVALGTAGCGAAVQGLVDELLVGRDPRGPRGHWQRMVDHVFKGGNKGLVNDAIWAIDVALWDLKAKLAGEPLWRHLGASTRRVRGYASGIDYCLSDQQLGEYYTSMAAAGICGGKLKLGLDPEGDLRRIGIMYEALRQSGKRPELMVDANEYWSPKQAVRYISYFEQHYDLTWVEEPTRRHDYVGLRKVSDGIRAAVASGENLDDVSEFRPLVAHGAVDVLNVGCYNSGITGCLQIADLAYAFDLPVTMMGCPGHFMSHVAAALPNHIAIEMVGLAGDGAFYTADVRVEDGWVVLGDAPGTGITIDEGALRQYQVTRSSRDAMGSTWGQSGWGRRRGAGLYLVGPDEPDELDD